MEALLLDARGEVDVTLLAEVDVSHPDYLELCWFAVKLEASSVKYVKPLPQQAHEFERIWMYALRDGASFADVPEELLANPGFFLGLAQTKRDSLAMFQLFDESTVRSDPECIRLALNYDMALNFRFCSGGVQGSMEWLEKAVVVAPHLMQYSSTLPSSAEYLRLLELKWQVVEFIPEPAFMRHSEAIFEFAMERGGQQCLRLALRRLSPDMSSVQILWCIARLLLGVGGPDHDLANLFGEDYLLLVHRCLQCMSQINRAVADVVEGLVVVEEQVVLFKVPCSYYRILVPGRLAAVGCPEQVLRRSLQERLSELPAESMSLAKWAVFLTPLALQQWRDPVHVVAWKDGSLLRALVSRQRARELRARWRVWLHHAAAIARRSSLFSVVGEDVLRCRVGGFLEEGALLGGL